ncbi:hypothetical protein Ahy_A04g017732 [Arachis hypogaea]|uniref:Aminotransferase-like plant mobile domain-containing protein n=1 Tax=Arachis hypogaea TaxID=3818 RepID=A0A445DBY8_ARAHY|nr:hypothetical protein Ahy_A04g017732 [Arachis hypogaea]
MTVCYTRFHERFRVLPADATDETVRIYARAYIMMLLSSQLFADKNANRVHLRWLPYLASLDDLGRYSWGSAALVWLYRCLCRGTNKNIVNMAGPLQLLQSWIFWRFPTLRPSGFDVFGFPLASRNDPRDQRLVSARLSLDQLRVHDFVWEPYSSAEVGAIIHPEILADEHRRLWTTVTSLIYFAVIEWHQVDRVLQQFGGLQHLLEPALNIDLLHAKDGRVIWVDRVLDSGPSSDYLEWWCRVAHRFLSPDVAFQNPRPIVLTEEARHRGSSQAPPRVRVYDRPDNRRADRRLRIGTRRDGRGGARGRVPSVDDQGTQHGVGEDVVGSASAMDQPTYDVGSSSQLFGNVTPDAFAGYTTAAVGMDIDDPVTESEFYRDIADMLMDDDGTHYRPQMPDDQPQFTDPQPQTYDVLPQLAVDLNEPAASPTDPWIPLGGTPASAFSGVPAQPSRPAAEQRPRRVRRPPLCGTGGHLLGQFDDDDSDTIEDSD